MTDLAPGPQLERRSGPPHRRAVRALVICALFAGGALLPALPADGATSKLGRLVQTAGKKAKPRAPTTKTATTKTATRAKATATATAGEKKKKDAPRVATAVSLPSFAPISSLAVEPQPALPPMVVRPVVKPIAAPLPAAPAAPAPAGAAVSADGLPEMPNDQEVLDVIRQNVAGVRACYLRLQRGGVHVSGKAMVSFLVSGQGHATDLRVDAPSFAGTTLQSCVTQQISRWVFPKSRKGIGPISYPFVFVGS